MSEVVFTAQVKNLPAQLEFEKYVVARAFETELWYYGTYPDEQKAKAVAEEIGNGVVLVRREVESCDE